MKSLFRSISLLMVATASPMMAGLVNAGFETGDLGGWTSSTFYTSSCFSCPASPYAATWYAVSQTPGVNSQSDVEAALNLSDGTLSSLLSVLQSQTGGSAGGTYLTQTLTMGAGDSITEYAFFFQLGDTDYNDTAFWSFSGPSTNAAGLIAQSSDVGYHGFTDWQPFNFTAPTDGTYTIGLGVFDAYSNESFIGVDAVEVATPEPGTAGFLAASMVLLAIRTRRARRRA